MRLVGTCDYTLQARDLERRAAPPLGAAAPLKCHFFSSMFMAKLFTVRRRHAASIAWPLVPCALEACAQDAKKYSYAEVRRWTLPQKLEAYGQVGGSACAV